MEQLALSDLDHGRTVTIASPPGRLQWWAAKHQVRWVDLPMTRSPKLADLSAVSGIRRLLPAAQVAYLHSSKAGAVGRMALATMPRHQRPRCIFVPHAWSWYVGGRAATGYRLFEGLASRWADAIVVLSPTEARDGRDVLPAAAANKLVLIPNGIDTAAFSVDGPAAARRPCPLVVCVGRLCQQKGQVALIRALDLLDDRTVRLSLVGDGPDERRLRLVADELGVADRVDFVATTDPRPYYRAADVVVLPSRWEGQSLVLLEAMACGAAVLATPAAASTMGPGEGVLGAEGPEPESLASPLALLLGDPDLRGQLGRSGRRVAAERHSATRTTRRHHELIVSLTGSSSPYSWPAPTGLSAGISRRRGRHSRSEDASIPTPVGTSRNE